MPRPCLLHVLRPSLALFQNAPDEKVPPNKRRREGNSTKLICDIHKEKRDGRGLVTAASSSYLFVPPSREKDTS